MTDLLVSVVTPVFDPDPADLQAMIDSVRAQTYPHWQLCLVDDGSRRSEVRAVLEQAAASDGRIKVRYRPTNGGISAASNDALAMAVGDWVALVDHDDLLHEDALGAVVDHLSRHPQADVVYTDEDKVGPDGRRFHEFRKPAWSYDLLLGLMYVGHLTVYRRQLLDEVGGFRSEYDGAQDWDLLLRVVERTQRVEHVRRVLYSWRVTEQSTAGGVGVKPYAADAGLRALRAHLERVGVAGRFTETALAGTYLLHREPVGTPLVSVLLPTAGGRRSVRGREVLLVEQAVRGLVEQNDWPHWELVLLANGAATDPALLARLEAIAGDRMRVVDVSGPFNFAAVINTGALHARGDLLLLLNDDVEPIGREWLREMVGFAADPGVGAVGAKLLFEDGTIQHAGVIHDGALPGHHSLRQPPGSGYFGTLLVNTDYAAVTGACLLVRRDAFEAVGGMSEKYPLNFNDIDFCLKLLASGYRNVYTPNAVLHHYESSTREAKVEQFEVDLMRHYWSSRMWDDPYWNRERADAPAVPAPAS